MSPDPPTVGFAGARPVADAPVDVLVDRADELATRWASALVAARPLAEMAEVPLQSLAREAPALCAQLARALSSDAELQRLVAPAPVVERGRSPEGSSSSAGRSGEFAAWLTPARDASSTVRDIEALRHVVWEAALGELRGPPVGQVADLSDRLACVCAALLAAALGRHQRTGLIDTPSAPVGLGREHVLYSSPQTTPGARRAVLIDERDEIAQPPERAREVPVTAASAAPSYQAARSAGETPERGQRGGPAPAAPRPRPWDTPLDAVSPTARGRQDSSPPRGIPDGADAEMRVTRGRAAPVDERA